MDKDFVTVWVTRKQERIAPADMTDSHLRNAIAYIRKNGPRIRKFYFEALTTDARSLPDPHWTEDGDDLEFILPVFAIMLAEAKRRGLESNE